MALTLDLPFQGIDIAIGKCILLQCKKLSLHKNIKRTYAFANSNFAHLTGLQTPSQLIGLNDLNLFKTSKINLDLRLKAN